MSKWRNDICHLILIQYINPLQQGRGKHAFGHLIDLIAHKLTDLSTACKFRFVCYGYIKIRLVLYIPEAL